MTAVNVTERNTVVRVAETNTTIAVREERVSVVTVGVQGPQGPQGEPGESGVQTATGTAGEAISALRVVRIDPSTGKFRYADKDSVTHAGSIAGITTSAAGANASVDVQILGVLADSGWNWNTAGDPGLYLGDDGAIVQGVPSGAFTQGVGFVVSATKIFVRISAPILN